MDDTLTILLPGDIPLEIILVPAGYFIMGNEAKDAINNEGPEHIVHVTKPFYIGKYPVTQGQWEAVMKKNPSRFSGAQRPVEHVSWLDIVEGNQDEDGTPAFLDLINGLLSKVYPDLAGSHEFRLPTEVEWEYATKGGPCFDQQILRKNKVMELYPTYSGSDQLETCGWYFENSNLETQPLGLKQANELGLYDMSGNVYEWCADWFGGDVNKIIENKINSEPIGPDIRGLRVVRGGGYWDNARYCRSTYRRLNLPKYRYDDIGFRLVLSLRLGLGTSG